MPPGPPCAFSETGMARRRLVYEGKAKILYEGPEPDTLIQHETEPPAPTYMEPKR